MCCHWTATTTGRGCGWYIPTVQITTHRWQDMAIHSISSGQRRGVCTEYFDYACWCPRKTYVFNKLTSHLQHHNDKVVCAAWIGNTHAWWYKVGHYMASSCSAGTCSCPEHACRAWVRIKDASFTIMRSSSLSNPDCSCRYRHGGHCRQVLFSSSGHGTGNFTQDSRPFVEKTPWLLLGASGKLFHEHLAPQLLSTPASSTHIAIIIIWPLFQQHKLTCMHAIILHTLPREGKFAAWLLQPAWNCLKNPLIDLKFFGERMALKYGLLQSAVHAVVKISLKSFLHTCISMVVGVTKVSFRTPVPSWTYLSTDSIKCDVDSEEERQNYSIEFLNSLTPSGMPPAKSWKSTQWWCFCVIYPSVKVDVCNGTHLKVTTCIWYYLYSGNNPDSGKCCSHSTPSN